uniref:Enoyl-CoA hydratase/isomerase domain-containing protein n=1 Tax=Opuntia streptacantha TaxID=393608 RepID=A0A7C9CSF0_OPUST
MQGFRRSIRLIKNFPFKPPFFPSYSSSASALIDRCTDVYIDGQRMQTSVMTEDSSSRCKMVVLNRPHALNAFDTPMVTQLLRLYRSWEEDVNVGFVVLKVLASR